MRTPLAVLRDALELVYAPTRYPDPKRPSRGASRDRHLNGKARIRARRLR